ncbi:superoxide dismutase [Saprospira sp. CCB-QB6]|uniref:superoxide dismutase n=1 Tax=Saprospira sp. CCB-QB6 TaxID=3023936 RepID=UPI002349D877|nr:superoxide dismutase [Saprospira sp. CCB-QB6]WCL81714.1 superoxide dismutase [Saprospira sp. CCB-QB6]
MMNKRTFLKRSATLALGASLSPLFLQSCQGEEPKKEEGQGKEEAATGLSEFVLPALPYAADALLPHIDTETMNIHHGKHHAGYVKKLNAALAGNPLQKEANSLEDLLGRLEEKEEHTALRNNGGGHYNHSLFWANMSPEGGGTPAGEFGQALEKAFGSFEQFANEFKAAAASRFGSGWAWLAVNAKKELYICSTPNQDNPLMGKIVEQPGQPILGLDVWEHAYYLNYQNQRKSYINSFFNIINWSAVAERWAKAVK